MSAAETVPAGERPDRITYDNYPGWMALLVDLSTGVAGAPIEEITIHGDGRQGWKWTTGAGSWLVAVGHPVDAVKKLAVEVEGPSGIWVFEGADAAAKALAFLRLVKAIAPPPLLPFAVVGGGGGVVTFPSAPFGPPSPFGLDPFGPYGLGFDPAAGNR